MYVPAHLHLSFDVDDPALAHVSPGGYAGRLAEHVFPHVQDGQAVDLPDLIPLDVYHKDVLVDKLDDLFLYKVGTVYLLVDGFFYVRRVDVFRVLLAGPVVGFTEYIGDVHETRAQLVLVVRKARSVLDDLRDRAPVEMAQALLLAPDLYERGVFLYFRRVPVHLDVEVGLYLEHFPEILVEPVKYLVKPRRAYHYDLDGRGYRLGFQAGSAYEAELFVYILDLYLVVADDPLERVPGHETAQDVHRLQYKVPAVGLVQRAGGYHSEIRAHGPEVGDVFYPAEQIVVGRVGLTDYRSALGVPVVHQEVDLVFEEGVLLGGPLYAEKHRLRGLVLLFPEHVYIIHYVLLHVVQVLHDVLELPVLEPELVYDVLHRKKSDLLLQFLYLGLHRFFHGAHFAEDLFDLYVELVLLSLYLLPFPVRELGVFLIVHGAVVHPGDEHHARGRLLQHEPLREGLFLYVLEDKVPFLLVFLKQVVLLGLVILALERPRDLQLELSDELLHVLLENYAPARRKRYGYGLVLMRKVINVYPVVGRIFLGGYLVDGLVDLGVPSGTRGPADKDVEPVRLDVEAEIYGADAPFLVQGFRLKLVVLGRLERKDRRVAGLLQIIDF